MTKITHTGVNPINKENNFDSKNTQPDIKALRPIVIKLPIRIIDNMEKPSV
ncbi:MAG: hypothetical protein ACO36C_01200 [Methylophilaceae bacterium]